MLRIWSYTHNIITYNVGKTIIPSLMQVDEKLPFIYNIDVKHYDLACVLW